MKGGGLEPAKSLTKGTFTLRLFSARFMTVTGKFRLPIGRLKLGGP